MAGCTTPIAAASKVSDIDEPAVSDLDVDPNRPMRVVAATRGGLTESLDGGITFTALAAQPPRELVLIAHIAHIAHIADIAHIAYVGGSDRGHHLVGVDAAGTVSSLGADGWQTAGSLPGPPTAFIVIGPDRYVSATGAQVPASDDAGRSWVLRARLDGSS